jgi:exosortase D (VPLPA-CTERM-specific)
MTALPPSGLQRSLGEPLREPAARGVPRQRAPLLLPVALVPLAAAFAPALRDIFFNWTNLPEYSYGPLVPAVAAAMVARDLRLAAAPARADWLGPVLVALGCVPGLLAAASPFVYPAELGLCLAIVGLFVGIQGRARARAAWPGLAYLLFALPLPGLLFGQLNIDLQTVSSALGVAIIRAFDVPVFREGNIIDLGGLELQVAEACSGLRYLFPLASFAFLAAYAFRGRAWERALLFLSALPVTVGMNSLRIGITGLLAERFGIGAAQGFFHDFEGWLVFCGCLGALLAEMKALCLADRGGGSLLARLELHWPKRAAGAAFAGEVSPAPTLAAAGVATAALLLALAIGGRDGVPPPREALDGFPRRIGAMSAVPAEIDPGEVEALALTDYASLDYFPVGADGRSAPVNLWIAYYASQKFGGSTHSPRFCIPGSGWTIDQLSVVSLDVGSAGSPHQARLNRAVISKGLDRELVYYWFHERGRSEADEYLVKFHILLDGIRENRTDGALVRLVTPLGRDAASMAAADKRLQDMSLRLIPLLPRYIPD